ncbi:MAG: ECF-type sigma factor [Gemmatimonadales bacterium]
MTNDAGDDASAEITALLRQAREGERQALEELLRAVYQELRQLAHGRLQLEAAGHTLNTTALVHEAYLRLIDQTRVQWRDRHHFFAVASEAMRRILTDYARRRLAAKRGSGAVHESLERVAESDGGGAAMSDEQARELEALDEALTRLSDFNPDGARVVQYRFFGGLSHGEVAEVMGISERTVRRVWIVAKGWLRHELRDLPSGQPTLFSSNG